MAYIGSAFLATHEAHADASYKQMIVNSKSADIVYTDVFTGVHANYLRDSIHAAGLDSAALMQSEKSSMDFGSEADARPKTWGPNNATAWRDIWGAGHGIGTVNDVVPAADLIARLHREYRNAKAELTRAAN